MSRPGRRVPISRRCVPLLVVPVIALVLVWSGVAGAAPMIRRPVPAAPAPAPEALGAPRVPVSVTRSAAFVVTGTVTASSPATGTISVIWYHYENGAWPARRSSPATLSAPGTYRAPASFLATGLWQARAVWTRAGREAVRSPLSLGSWARPTADAIVWNDDGVLTLPERMSSRLDSRQIIVVTGPSLGSTSGTLRLFAYRNGDWVQQLAVSARFGSNGLTDGATRVAGNRTTPTGIWRTPGYAFGTGSAPLAGTHLGWRRIGPDSWWSSERDSTYNCWVESASHIDGEHLADYPVQYEMAMSSGFNAPPNQTVFGRGTAIFIHCFGPGLTAGCVSIARTDMGRLLIALDPKAGLACAIGTEQAGAATAIYSY